MQGQWQFEAEREFVWQALTDPSLVAQCIPNCEKMEPTGDDTYLATMVVGIGSVKGRFTATIRLTDQQFPERYRLIVEAKSPIGFVKGDGLIALQEVAEGQTQVSIDGEVQVGGTLASIGSRVIAAAANAQLNHFFEAMRQQVAARKGIATTAPEEATQKPTVEN